MFSKLKRKWHELRDLPAGRRFRTVNERQANAPAWVRPVLISGAVIAFGIGILLSVLPGPAFVFFGIAGALAATVSRSVARALDGAELTLRRLYGRYRRWRARKKRTARSPAH